MSDAPENKNDIHPVSRRFLWLDKAWAREAPFWIFLVLALGLLSVEFVHHRHGYSQIEESFGFYVWMGFFGFCFAVLMGWPLRALLSKPADYYERGAEDE